MTAAQISLPSRLDATTLGEVLATLKTKRGAPLDLDGSTVDRIGGQGLQLLLSAQRTWRNDGHALRVTTPSDTLVAALGQLGMPTDSLTGSDAHA